MTDPNPEQTENETPASADATATETAPQNSESSEESLSSPEFQDLKRGNADPSKKADLNRFQDVQVTVAAELGRINVSIHDLLDLTEGSVFELNRSISAPVELIAQGIPLGNGEVVVVEDSFAIRIKEIYATS